MIIKESANSQNDRLVSVLETFAMTEMDGPGIRVIVFFQGCPVDCAWCHSPHLKIIHTLLLFYEQSCSMCMRCQTVCRQNVHGFEKGKHFLDRKTCIRCGKCIETCPNSSVYSEVGALKLSTKKVSVKYLFEQVFPHVSLCEGITLSGGEALWQENTIEFLRMCKENNVNTCVETSGLLENNCYLKALPFVDIWLFGVLVLTDNNSDFHSEKLISNAKIIKSNTKNLIIPVITLVPEITDRKDVLEKILSVLEVIDSKNLQLNVWNNSYDVYYKFSGIQPRFTNPADDVNRRCETEVRNFLTKNGYNIIKPKGGI